MSKFKEDRNEFFGKFIAFSIFAVFVAILIKGLAWMAGIGLSFGQAFALSVILSFLHVRVQVHYRNKLIIAKAGRRS